MANDNRQHNDEKVATATLNNETQDYAASGSTVESRRLAGKYVLFERLGAGGMATVYRARDQQRDSDVAIKFMKSDLGGTARRRFFREFNTIAGINHPCCLQVFEIGESSDGPFFSMELHPGQSIDRFIGDSPADLAQPLIHLTLAIDYIHSQGIVHRDIKPSNVLVQRTTRDGKAQIDAKLSDFGLAKFYQLDSSLTSDRAMVGTAAYCAPEQIEGSQIDHRVDLYAMGIMAFELLSGGRHPFAAERTAGTHALLNAHLSKEPPRLIDVNPDISIALSEVVGSYLAKDAESRPGSALPLRKVLCENYGVEIEAQLDALSSPSEVRLNAIGFVCREKELERVDDFLKRSFVPQSASAPGAWETENALLLFSGEPGAGKTSIMQESVRRAIGTGYLVLEGRCFDGGTTSFQPIIELLKKILTRLACRRSSVDEITLMADLPAADSELQRMGVVIADYQNELLLVAPELRRWIEGAQKQVPFQQDPDSLFRALAELFIDLSQIHPLCLCVDDIQWADNSTLKLLHQLAAAISLAGDDRDASSPSNQSSNSDEKRARIAILATGRSGYPRLDKFRMQMQKQSLLGEIEMKPMSRDETRQLLALRLGCLPSSLADQLVVSFEKLCQGNPFFISETIREWYARGSVIRTSEGWKRVAESDQDGSSLPSTVRSALRTRIDDISEAGQTLLHYSAVIGRVVDLDLLEQVVPELQQTTLLDAVDELLSKRFFVETGSASRVSFAHDLLRETLLMDLSGSRRRSIHRKIAAILEAKQCANPQSVNDVLLAQHYLAGEMTEKAFHSFLNAAEVAIRTYAFEDAGEHLKKAEENQPPAVDDAARFRMYCLLSEVAGHTNELQRAAEFAETSLSYSKDMIDRARLKHSNATYLFRLGAIDESKKRYDGALAELGLKRTKIWPLQLMSIQWSLFGYHMLPRPILKLFNRGKHREDKYALASAIYYDFAHLLVTRELLSYTDVCSLNVCCAKSIQSNKAKAYAFSKYALNLAFGGANARIGFRPHQVPTIALRYALSGYEAAKKTGEPDVIARVQTSLGFAHYCAGNLEEATTTLLEAEKVLLKCRDLHTAYCYHYLRHTYSVMGQPARILDAGMKELNHAQSSKDMELLGWAQFGLIHGLALKGDFAAANDSAEEAVSLLTATHSSFISVAFHEQGFALLQNSDYKGAALVFHQAIQVIKNRFAYFEVMIPAYPRLVEALLGPSWVDKKRSQTDANLSEAKKYLRASKFFRISYPNLRPHAWRVQGRFLFATKKFAEARKAFERAIVEADKLGARYELARSYDDLGRAFPELTENRQKGQDMLRELGAVMPEAELGD